MAAIRTKGLLVIASGLFSLSLHATALAAQETLRGRVADASDSPLPGAIVVLHAVSEQAGNELDRDTADADGRFELDYPFEEGPLYFVATRIDGEIFMAEPFRAPPSGELDLRAGPGVEPLRMDGAEGEGPADAPRATAARDSEHGGWWVGALAALIVGAVAWLAHRNRQRAPRARELLLEIARLDEASASAGSAATDATYRTRRDELRARLVESLELDPDADRH